MSAVDRPWWATGEDALDPGVDPLEAHRAARRGSDAGPDDAAPGPPADGAAPGPPARGEAEDAAPGDTAAADATADGDAADPRRGGRAVDDGSWWVPATEAITRLARDLAASPPRGLFEDPQADPDAAADREDARAGRPAGDGGRTGGGHRIDACGVCPICVGMRALGDARPDLVGHLAEAARQLALAVRTVVDAAAPADDPAAPPAPSDRGGGRRRAGDDLHRIDLDD